MLAGHGGRFLVKGDNTLKAEAFWEKETYLSWDQKTEEHKLSTECGCI